MKKIANVCKLIFGYGIMLCLLAGGMTFFGFVAAICIGGDTAAEICRVLKEGVIPVIIYASTVLVLFGLVTMYLAGEKSLTPTKRKK